jgi:hypothetical protein
MRAVPWMAVPSRNGPPPRPARLIRNVGEKVRGPCVGRFTWLIWGRTGIGIGNRGIVGAGGAPLSPRFFFSQRFAFGDPPSLPPFHTCSPFLCSFLSNEPSLCGVRGALLPLLSSLLSARSSSPRAVPSTARVVSVRALLWLRCSVEVLDHPFQPSVQTN